MEAKKGDRILFRKTGDDSATQTPGQVIDIKGRFYVVADQDGNRHDITAGDIYKLRNAMGSEAWKEGRTAGENGLPKSGNKYPFNTTAWYDWQKGWLSGHNSRKNRTLNSSPFENGRAKAESAITSRIENGAPFKGIVYKENGQEIKKPCTESEANKLTAELDKKGIEWSAWYGSGWK